MSIDLAAANAELAGKTPQENIAWAIAHSMTSPPVR